MNIAERRPIQLLVNKLITNQFNGMILLLPKLILLVLRIVFTSLFEYPKHSVGNRVILRLSGCSLSSIAAMIFLEVNFFKSRRASDG